MNHTCDILRILNARAFSVNFVKSSLFVIRNAEFHPVPSEACMVYVPNARVDKSAFHREITICGKPTPNRLRASYYVDTMYRNICWINKPWAACVWHKTLPKPLLLFTHYSRHALFQYGEKRGHVCMWWISLWFVATSIFCIGFRNSALVSIDESPRECVDRVSFDTLCMFLK